MYKTAITFLGAAALALIALPAFAAGSNGSFEAGNDPGTFLTVSAGDSTSITDWTVDSGSVDYIGSYWQAADGARSVDLNGLETGSVSQTLATTPGATYTVTFSLSGNPDSRSDQSDPYYSPSAKVLGVTATGASLQTYTFDTASMGNSLANMMWQPETYTFVATNSSTVLTFASQIPGAFGPALDNVVVSENIPDAATCPAGRIANFVETVTVPSNSSVPTATLASLAGGQPYLLVASGTWDNTGKNTTDAEYASTDAWASVMDGYNITPYFLGTGEFDLQVDSGFINWGAYNPTHQYSYLYTGTGAPAQFMVFDGDSTQPNPAPEAGWYGDNAGSLSVDVYSCDNPGGTISGMKYNDLNRNGKKDANEPGLPGWTIRLLLDGPNDADTLIATAITDANGNYTFTDIAPGTYDVREKHQKGWKRMSKNPKDIVIVGGSVVTDVNFGNAQTRRGEKDDTDKDDNRDDQHGNYYANQGHSNYDHDQNNTGHESPDNHENNHGGNHNH